MKRFALILTFLSLVAGIVTGTHISSIEPLLYFLVLAIISFIILLIVKQNKGIAALCIIFAIFSIYSFLVNIDPCVEQTRHDFSARVFGNVKDNGNKLSFVADNITIDGVKSTERAYCTVRKNQQGSKNISDGALISFTGKSYYPEAPKGKYSFDFNAYLKKKHIRLGITSIKDIRVINETDSMYPVADIPFRIREQIRNVFSINLSQENAQIATSLLVSNNDNANNEYMTLFSKIGIAHIFSVSGLHVSIVAGCILYFLKKLHIKKIVSSLIATLALGLYCYISGFSPATQRAYIMFIYLIIANNIFARYQLINGLAISGIIILAINPLMLYSQGFIFSFCAILGICLFESELSSIFIKEQYEYTISIVNKIKYYLIKGFTLSLSVQLGILIPSVYFYGQINILSLLYNIIILPIISAYLMPLALISLVFSFIPIISDLLFFVLDSSLSIFMTILKSTASSAFIKLPRFSLNSVILFVSIVLIIQKGLFRVNLQKKLVAIFSMLVITITSAILSYNSNPTYVQLSVGRADAAIVQSGRNTILVDTGEMGTEVLNYIKINGVNIKDAYISHADLDHYGGLRLLLDNDIGIENIYIANGTLANEEAKGLKSVLSEYERRGTKVSKIGSGFSKEYDKFSIKAVFPKSTKIILSRPTNDNSLSLMIDILDTKLLTTGDLPKRYEKYAAQKCDILKLGHHASNTSTSEEFLQKCNASVAIISANNTEGFPSEKVIGRLKKANIPYFNTGDKGNIVICFNEGEYTIK